MLILACVHTEHPATKDRLRFSKCGGMSTNCGGFPVLRTSAKYRKMRTASIDTPAAMVQHMIARIACVCFLVVGASPPCIAATVFLQNSDRLSGEIEKLEGKHLSLKTAYAGMIEIDWTMVQG